MIRKIGVALALVIVAVVVATAWSWRKGDDALYPAIPGAEAVAIEVVSNGFHSGLAIPCETLREAAARLSLNRLRTVAERFEPCAVLEIGWGEARFYRSTPTLGSLDLALGLSALFRPGNASVVHVAALTDRAERVLAADTVPVRLSRPGFDAMARQLDLTLANGRDDAVRELGPGLSRNSLFFDGEGTFSILHLCNHWTSDMLDAAGLPTVRFWATLPDGLLLSLRLRAGLRAVSRKAPSSG